jgi:hypothetical protein
MRHLHTGQPLHRLDVVLPQFEVSKVGEMDVENILHQTSPVVVIYIIPAQHIFNSTMSHVLVFLSDSRLDSLLHSPRVDENVSYSSIMLNFYKAQIN